jgi:hypothetical protein
MILRAVEEDQNVSEARKHLPACQRPTATGRGKRRLSACAILSLLAFALPAAANDRPR